MKNQLTVYPSDTSFLHDDQPEELSISRNQGRNFYPVRIFIDCGKKLTGIDVADIAYCKANKDYTQIVTADNERLLSSKGISKLEQSFDPKYFIRIHRSYIINLRHAKLITSEFSRYFFHINDMDIPVSRYYLKQIKQLIF